MERPALTSSPFYLICSVPLQVCKKNGWIRHGLSSPTKTVQKCQMKTKAADQQSSCAGCMGHRWTSAMGGSGCIYWSPTTFVITCWSSKCAWTLSHQLGLVVFLSLHVSERSKLWSLLIYLKSILKRSSEKPVDTIVTKWSHKTAKYFCSQLRKHQLHLCLKPIWSEKLKASAIAGWSFWWDYSLNVLECD